MECTSCRASIDHRAAFCPKCGEITSLGLPFSQKLANALFELGEGLGKVVNAAIDCATDEANRKIVIGGSVVIAFLLVALTENPISNGIASILEAEEPEPQMTAEGLPDFSNYADVFLSEEMEYFVTGPANVRNFPTSEESRVINSIAEGETVLAREVKAFDPSSKWFKLTSGGYVWGGNLRSVDQIGHEVEHIFPAWTQGKWSTKDQCPRVNGGDIYVVIEGSKLYVNGNGSRLVGIAKDSAGTSYFIKPLEQANYFDMTIELTPSADGRSITLIHTEPHDIDPWYLFDDGLPCDSIMRR